MSDNPAGVEAKVGRAVLDRILLDVLESTGDRVERERVATAFSRARVALGQVESTGPAQARHYERIAEAEGALRDVMALLVATVGEEHVALGKLRTLVEALVGGRQAALEMAGSSAGDEAAAEAPREPFHASHGVPQLHHLPRARLVMRNRPKPAAASLDVPWHMADHLREVLLATARKAIFEGEEAFAGDLDDAAPQALEAPDGGEAGPREDGLVSLRRSRAPNGTERMLQRMCVDALEEIGALGVLRDVQGRERWEGVSRLEARLLANLDAVVALGREGPVTIDVLDVAMRWAADSPATDPFRAFAQAFVLGCVHGVGPATTAVLAMRALVPDVRGAFARGLALASSPAVDDALEETLVDAEGDLVMAVLDAMRSRRSASVAAVAPLSSHVDERVRMAVARVLLVAEPRGAALERLQRLLVDEQDDRVVAAALETLAVLDLEASRAQLRQRLYDDVDDDGQLSHQGRRTMGLTLAVVGERDDFEILRGMVERHPGDARLAGWHGDRRWGPMLLELLEHEAPAAGMAAAASLHRLTGASLPLPESPNPDPYRPRVDAAAWRTWWTDHGEELGEEPRVRLGRAYTADATAEELLAERVPMADRHLLALELAVASGEPFVDPRDWTVNQQAAVAQARSTKAVRQSLAGAWIKPRR